jgi:type III secretion protein C
MAKHAIGRAAILVRRTLLAASLMALAGGASAAPLQLPATPYRYTVIDQDLVAALQEFGSNMSIRMNISPEVRGRVQGPFPDLSAREFFDRILRHNNLEAYYDGSVLHVTSAKEVQSRLLVLGPVPFARFERVLNAFQITDTRYNVRRAPDADVALASGPPRFIALVEQTLTGLVAEEQGRPKPGEKPDVEASVTVFRGSQTQVLRGGRVVYYYPEAPRAPAAASSAPPPEGPAPRPPQAR